MTAVIFVLTVLAIALLAVQLEVLELKEGDPGTGHGHGGGGDGNKTGKGKGAGEATTPKDLGSGDTGKSERAGIAYDPGGGGSGGLVPYEEPDEEEPEEREKPESEPEERGTVGAGKAIGTEIRKGKGSGGGTFGFGQADQSGGGGGGGGNKPGTEIPQIVLPEKVKWLLLIVIIIGITAAMVYLGRSYIRSREAALKKRASKPKKKKKKADIMAKAVAEEVIETIEMTYDAIAGMGDIRKAIVACYARLCSVISDKGVVRSPDMTPREFYGVFTSSLERRSVSIKGLTLMFEEAVFSEHAMGAGHRDKALRLLKTSVKEVKAW